MIYRESITPARTYSFRTPSAVLAREYDRILYKPRPRVGYRPLENYLNSESFIVSNVQPKNKFMY